MTLLSPAATAADAHPVLLVCSHPGHVAEVRQALDAWPERVLLNTASSTMPALREVILQPLALVIVDWALDGFGGQALIRQLARLRPALPVLAFDTCGVVGPAQRMQAWPWSQLTTVLDQWRRP